MEKITIDKIELDILHSALTSIEANYKERVSEINAYKKRPFDMGRATAYEEMLHELEALFMVHNQIIRSGEQE